MTGQQNTTESNEAKSERYFDWFMWLMQCAIAAFWSVVVLSYLWALGTAFWHLLMYSFVFNVFFFGFILMFAFIVVGRLIAAAITRELGKSPKS